MHRLPRLALAATLVALVMTGSGTGSPAPAAAAGATVDEVTYAFGNERTEVVVSWRGAEPTLFWGADSSDDNQVTATRSAITPVDIAGPFYEARISGLTPGTTYHYKIGATGTERVFHTAPANADDFTAVVIADTEATICRTYQAQLFGLVAALDADMVLHHGDHAIANDCGVPAVHQYFLDLETTLANGASFQPTWGNHEYGPPTADAPPGTPRDTLANYKGRVAMPNAQTVPNDKTTQLSHPGCGQETGSRVNTCLGEDWGWFRAGRVLFIGYPEPEPGAIADWQKKADVLMADAQANTTVDFVVTYGHRPVVSSTSYTPPTGWATAFDALAAKYSPTARAGGKYVLNFAGHRHNLEVFGSRKGVTHVVNGGGGQGLIKFGSTVAGSTWRMKHLGFSTLRYSATARTLAFSVICGPAHPSQSGTCTPGSTLYSRTYTAA
jgi:hypothetical protein